VQQARNLKLEASGNINVSLTAPVDNTVILPNGSLQLVAGGDINYNPSAAGNTIGTAGATLDRNISFTAADNIDINNAMYLGALSVLNLKANQNVSMNSGAVNIAATGGGDITLRGNHQVSTGGNINLMGVDLSVLGGDLGSANQSMAGEQLVSTSGIVTLGMTGNVLIQAAAATANSDSAAIIKGSSVSLGSLLQRANNLTLIGGSNSVNAGVSRHSDAAIDGASGIFLSGNLTMTGGNADITGSALNDTAQSTAQARIAGGTSMNILGNVLMTGGTATAANGISSGNEFAADASALIAGGSAFTVGGNWAMQGGSSAANAASGKTARAAAEAQVKSATINATIGGALTMTGGTSLADTTAGGTLALANADALWSPSTAMKLDVSGAINLTGGNATVAGTNTRALAIAGTESTTTQVGSTLEVKSGNNINLTAGTEVGGTDALSSGAFFYGGEIKVMLSGGMLTLTGDQGSGLFQFLNPQFLRVDGKNYPVTISGGSVQFILNALLGDALVLSGAPPLNLGALSSPLLTALNATQQARIDSYASAKAAFDQQNAGKKLCN